MAEPWIKYQNQPYTYDREREEAEQARRTVENTVYKQGNAFDPYKYQGIEGLLGTLETVDYLTAAPVRYGVMETIRGLKQGNYGPWNFFKGAKKSFANPRTAPSGKDISKELGLSEKGLNRITGDQYAPNVSPAGLAGFALENVLDPTNLVGAGLFGAGIKAVGKADDLLKQAKNFKSADEFIKSLNDYKMTHRPTEGVRAFNLIEPVNGENMIPKDMYERWYGSRGTQEDLESIKALKQIKDKPEAEVTIYRASPKKEFNYGDWVSLSKGYAKQHAEANGLKVYSQKVKAKDLKWAMDDINEFGYYPDSYKQNLTDIWNQANKADDVLPRNSKEYTENFKNWFGDSKVVDKDGKPLVVYHGTTGDFDMFSRDKGGYNTGAQSARKGIFLTENPEVASGYANIGGMRVPDDYVYRGPKRSYKDVDDLYRIAIKGGPNIFDNPVTGVKDMFAINVVRNASNLKKIRDDMLNGDSFEKAVANHGSADLFGGELVSIEGFHGGNVMPTYVNIKNPLEFDFKGESYRERTYSELIDQAVSEGRDGTIFYNTFDEAVPMENPKPHTVYMAFDPAQIKSATGNRGTFDPKDPNILKGLAPVAGPWLYFQNTRQERTQNEY